MAKKYQFFDGPLDGLWVQMEEGKEPPEIECRIKEDGLVFHWYALTEEDQYYYLGHSDQPQDGISHWVDVAPVAVVVGKGKLKEKLLVWAIVERIKGDR